MKKLFLILFLLLNSNIFADDIKTDIKTDVKANIALDKILNQSINALILAKKENPQLNKNGVEKIIQEHLLPFIATKISAENSLKEHWNKLNDNQKLNLEKYIVDSLSNDYVGILAGFNDFDKIKIEVDEKIKTKDNKAIVTINFITTEKNQPIMVAAKMIKNDIWKIYDIVFSGVSLIKNYESQFNSYIKRKGFEKFSSKYLD
jgi:phospholipid transport system substrate-binding protein